MHGTTIVDFDICNRMASFQINLPRALDLLFEVTKFDICQQMTNSKVVPHNIDLIIQGQIFQMLLITDIESLPQIF